MAARFTRLMPATDMDGIDAAPLDLCTGQPAILATHDHAYPARLHEQLEAAVQPTASLQARLPGIAVNSSGKPGISPV